MRINQFDVQVRKTILVRWDSVHYLVGVEDLEK